MCYLYPCFSAEARPEMFGAEGRRSFGKISELYIIKKHLKCNLKHLNTLNPLTSRPECMPGSRYTGVGVLFFVI